MRKTKIVATIGPKSNSPEMIEKLIKAGLNVCRLNFSHGSHEHHGETINNIRSISKKLNKPIAILQDLAGPKIRIGMIQSEPITLKPDHRITFTNQDVPGDENIISLSYKKLPSEIKIGEKILLADGSLELIVEEKSDHDFTCKIIIGGQLSSKKGMNLPDTNMTIPALTEKDKLDLEFGLKNGVDFVALSFVRNPKDIIELRQIINQNNSHAGLLAKIEKNEALNNIDEILALSDGIMIARGDLGVETPIEKIPSIQKQLIKKAYMQAKIVITATQMLGSMVNSPRPTRAEVTDVANAVFDGTGAVMLSEETAVGKYPETTIKMMSAIAENAEATLLQSPIPIDRRKRIISDQESIAFSAFENARNIDAAAIITFTQSGSTSRMISKYKPAQSILALTPDINSYRKLSLIWGVVPIFIKHDELLRKMDKQAINIARQYGYAKPGQKIVLTAGLPLYQSGTTNLLKITNVD